MVAWAPILHNPGRIAIAGFWDASLWEEVKRRGDTAIRNMINTALVNTSVTVVLIGNETSTRKYVQYEIQKSYELGKGMLGVHINGIRNERGLADYRGRNPFDELYVTINGIQIPLSRYYPTYDWLANQGFNNFATWVENAAIAAGR